MRITPTGLGESRLIVADKIEDARGYLIETYDEAALAKEGLPTRWVSQVQTVTRGCGIVRGMHWQAAPHEQGKLVRCISGLVMDVLVDIRPDSADFGKHKMIELSGDNMHALYIPQGFAHGFQCISEFCVMSYLFTEKYNQRSARSFYCEDSEVGIRWPLPIMKLSDQDAAAPLLSNAINRA